MLGRKDKYLHADQSNQRNGASISPLAMALLFGWLLGIGGLVFAAVEVNNLYSRHLLPEIMQTQDGGPSATSRLAARLGQLPADKLTPANEAEVAEVVEPYERNVFLEDVLVTDKNGQKIYQLSKDPEMLQSMLRRVRESGVLDGTGQSDILEGTDKQRVCRTRPIKDKDGNIIGAVLVHRSLSPIPEKMDVARGKFILVGALTLGAIFVALTLVMLAAFGLVRRGQALQHKNMRLEALSTFASGLAHEIQNPLNAIALTSQYLKQLMRGKREQANDVTCGVHENVEKNLGVFHDEMNRIKAILQDFMNFAKPVKLQKEQSSLRELVGHSTSVFETEMKEKSIALDVQVSEGLLVPLDKGRMQQVFVNLIKNAMEAMDQKGGKLTITAARKRDGAEINFRDSGSGMAPEQMVHLFEPYFSTKKGGQGLGLPITRNIVESHGGKISATSSPGEGTTFTINIPFA